MLLLLLACAPPATEGALQVASGEYLVREPPDGIRSTLLWFHGYSADAESTFSNRGLVETAAELGVLIIAPVGIDQSWSSRNSPGVQSGDRDEIAFSQQVLDDAAERFGDLGPVLAGGASHGASLPYQLACETEQVDRVAAYMGTFWDPMPQECTASPKDLRHVHGTADTTWPMDEGREIWTSRQGDVVEVLDLWRDTLRCEPTPSAVEEEGMECEAWSCSDGEVRLCLHPGGHTKPDGWGIRMLRWNQERIDGG